MADKKKTHPVRTTASRTDGYWKVARRVLISHWFFWGFVGVFVFQAVWLALSGRYSMAYDEYFHFGIIKEYAAQLTPFIEIRPDTPLELGAVTRDPSFIYHYLFSFPYRVTANFTDSFVAQIGVLRILNIGVFVAAFAVYLRLLTKLTGRRWIAVLVLFVLSLLPTAVMLASQINYDGLMLLMVGISVLLALNVIETLKIERAIRPVQFLGLIVALAVGSLVKYAFLPVAATIFIFVVAQAATALRHHKPRLSATRRVFIQSLKRPIMWIMLVFVLASAVFVGQRLGLNIIEYHTPIPRCDQVLTDEQCRAYDPYRRNANLQASRADINITGQDIARYPFHWFFQMIWETFFVVGSREQGYPTRHPVNTAYFAGKVIVIGMMVIFLMRLPWLWRQGAAIKLAMLVSCVYLVVLYTRNFTDYWHLGMPVAIHGRYALFSVTLIGALVIYAVVASMRPRVKKALAIAAVPLIAMLIWGGGWVPFVLRSSDAWVWDHMAPANRVVRSVMEQVVPKRNYLLWQYARDPVWTNRDVITF